MLVLAGAAAMACQVPVFRFALERWSADQYRAVVTPGASGKLSDAEQSAFDRLKTAATEAEAAANLRVYLADEASGASEPVATATAEARLDLFYPEKIRGFATKPIWSGPLNEDTARKLLDSPIRREIVKKLLSGESAVWLLLESGEAEKDDAALAAMEQANAQAREKLRVPDGVVTRSQAETLPISAPVNADDVLRSEVPLKIDFSVLRIGRDDPAEALFRAMLLNIEDDLREFSAEPMVFPVFGRGRLLEPLIGRGVSDINALDYATYICGACSCEVKDQNPGMDLLISANWDAALVGSEIVMEKILPPLEGTAILMQAAADAGSGDATPDDSGQNPAAAAAAAAVPASEPEEEAAAATANRRVLAPILAIGLVVLLGISVGTLMLLRRKSP
ncbi:MAG: hypothetical protein KDM91_04095 [Verrucomicrobiae bacterium]|nr:hypothetical protein [Verrucomicrobiae bacterium]